MSTITVSNIKATGETVGRAVSGVAAAWGNLNCGSGATAAARGGVNISSVTDYATGDYGLTVSSAMADTDWSFVASTSFQGGTSRNIISVATQAGTAALAPTTTHVRWEISNYNSGLYDADFVMCAIHGDLA